MKEKGLLTKNCILPWKSFVLWPDGKIAPCCGVPIPDGDFGNINSIDFNLPAQEALRAVFASDAYVKLRSQLLEGTPQKACLDCRVVADDDISPDSLRVKVVEHLRYYGEKISKGSDLTSEFHMTECFTNVTDKCNFSCIYCFLHSNDLFEKKQNEYYEIDRKSFLKLVSVLAANGLQYLNFCGNGELTIYPHWQDLCLEVINKFPNVKLTVVSNFGKRLSDADLDILMRFCEINVSCDSLDPVKYAWLRPGGRLSVLLENVSNLRDKFKPHANNPKLIFIVTESDAIIDDLNDLAKFAIDRNISLRISNLSLVEDSVATKTKCLKKIADVPDSQILHAWEVINDLPRRIRAQNPPLGVYCELGPLFNAVKCRAEEISFNRFVPTEDEIVYNLFASTHVKNPEAYLRKIFLSFDVCIKGIFVKSGCSVEIKLPFSKGILKYRPILCKEIPGKELKLIFCDIATVFVEEHLSLTAVKSVGKFTHLLFEISTYELCTEGQPVTGTLSSSLNMPMFARKYNVPEYSCHRDKFIVSISETLRAYPVIHKFAANILKYVVRHFLKSN